MEPTSCCLAQIRSRFPKKPSTLELQCRCATLPALVLAHFSLCRLPTKLLLNTAHRLPPPPHPFLSVKRRRAAERLTAWLAISPRLVGCQSHVVHAQTREDGCWRWEMGNRALQPFRPATSPHAEVRCNLVHLFGYLGHLCNSRFS